MGYLLLLACGFSASDVFFSIRIIGEPAAGYAVALLEDFFDGPEGGESEYAQEGLGENGAYEEGCYGCGDAQKQEPPPAACAEPVVTFDDNGMEYPDYQKGAYA